MDLTIINTDLYPTVIIDSYESFIWTDRFHKHGDFELYTSVTKELLANIKQEYYVQNRESEHVMIIEKILIKSDAESGNRITVSGRSLESILDRRIVWKRTVLNGNLQNGIKRLLDENVISPSDPNRKIDNFVFEPSTDSTIVKLSIRAQYTGDNLYDVIEKICCDNGIGFKITLNDQRQFVFKLYAGIDRSYKQIENPYVVFSPNFDNIINSNYVESKMALKNVVLVGGEGDGNDRKFAEIGTASGLDRREMFVDARDISSDPNNDGTAISDEEYDAQLQQRGYEEMEEYAEVNSFEGAIDTTTMYRYGEDFFIGDIVQIADDYGHESRVRILEIVMAEDVQGISIYPTFESVEEGE